MNRIIRKLLLIPNRNCVCRRFHEEFASKEPSNVDLLKRKAAPNASKYEIFENDSHIILDIDEEREKIAEGVIDMYNKEKKVRDVYFGINLERGQSGVYTIQDLVDVLRKENAEHIFVCSVPKEFKYVDYICIVSGRSKRHINAIGEFVRKVYKMKRNSTDILPKLEGENSSSWVAMDLGNIALHIFSPETRAIYDLESLWSIGPEYDKECNKPASALVELYEKHSIYLSDLTPKV